MTAKANLWQNTLTLVSAKNLHRVKEFQAKAALPEGKYLVKLYLDAENKLAKDWKMNLSDKEKVGEVEVQSAWKAGYGVMTSVKAPLK